MDFSSYLELFVAEAREHIGAASELASQVHRREAGEAGLRELFRHVHSVKGMAASMGFGSMTALAHDAESLMETLRHGRIAPHVTTGRLLCDALACLERMVDRAEAKEPVDDEERAPLQEGLRRVLSGTGDQVGTTPAADAGGSAGPSRPKTTEAAAGCVKLALIVRRDREYPSVRAAVVLGRLAKFGTLQQIDPPMAALRTGRFDGRLKVTLVSELPLRTLGAKIAALDEIDNFTLVPAEAPAAEPAVPEAKPSLRVRADRVDALIEDVLELMSTIGRVDAGLLAASPGSPSACEIDGARRLARRAYDGLVDMRLVRFEVVSQRLRRAVEALSRKLDKPVVFEVSGADVRIDRSQLERLVDPLLHMVRNAVDHGIESWEARRAAGKPPAGNLRIRVDRRAGKLAISVEDDGRGLDPTHLKHVAVERGLLTPLEAVRLSDDDAFRLITIPGFSTVDETTEVSGRGVGMDVVRNAIEAMGGQLAILARAGRGTRFTLSLPPSVTLIQSYVVRACGTAFAVPLSTISRMAPMDDQATAWRDGRRFWIAASEEIPVWALGDVLGLTTGSRTGTGMALITESDRGIPVAIEVDDVVYRRELVVRPLPMPLSNLRGYLGAAVLDDGSIVLVLDPATLPLG